MYCVYVAEDEDAVVEHAQLSGFPALRISRVTGVLDPTSADPCLRASSPFQCRQPLHHRGVDVGEAVAPGVDSGAGEDEERELSQLQLDPGWVVVATASPSLVRRLIPAPILCSAARWESHT